jgi:hypothetical protein
MDLLTTNRILVLSILIFCCQISIKAQEEETLQQTQRQPQQQGSQIGGLLSGENDN